MLQTLDRITGHWSFGHVVLLALAVGVVVAAALLTPTTDAVSLFGREIPAVCGWRIATGWPCPGCGLTRSFAFAAHGRVVEAFQMHWLGPIFFAAVALQIPWRIVILARGRPDTAVSWASRG